MSTTGEMRIVNEQYMADGSVILTFENVSPEFANALAERGKDVAIRRFSNCLQEKLLTDGDDALPATFELPTRLECISIGLNDILLTIINWTEDERKELAKTATVPAV